MTPASAERPTLLVFTLGAEAECARRGLLPASLRETELAIHRHCLERSVRAGLEAGCRVVVSSPRRIDVGVEADHLPQRGGSFGARLQAAVKEVGRRHRGPLILVGSDAPELSATEISIAVDSLRRRPQTVVLGPARDGGFYLLAGHGPFDEELAAVDWCCSETTATLLAALAASGRPVELLGELGDLDRPADLGHWLVGRRAQADPWRALVDLVRRQLQQLSRPLAPVRLGRELRYAAAPARGRAPPH